MSAVHLTTPFKSSGAASGLKPDLESYMERTSAMELARRSKVGAPAFAVVSLLLLIGTPFFQDLGWVVAIEAALIIALSAVRVWYAMGFEELYDQIGERAVLGFNILTALQSLTLGVIAAVAIWVYWESHEAVLTITLCAGCVAAGTSALSVRPSARAIFLVCILLPFGVAVNLVGGLDKALFITGFLVLMAYLVQDGGLARRSFLQQLRDSYNAELARKWAKAGKAAHRELMADLNHELRTPINSIVGMTTLLLDENLEKRQRELATIIRNSGRALLDLTEGRLEAIDPSSDQSSAKLSSVELKRELEEVIERFRPRASAKGIRLDSHLDDIPDSVDFLAENYVGQVLVNLLNNAVEHTQDGSITVRASSKAMEREVMGLEFTVSDTGAGMKPEQLDSVFELNGAPQVKQNGTFGARMGLPMSKGLTELMGGTIWIDSSVGKGTTVGFNIRVLIDDDRSLWHTGKAHTAEEPGEIPHNLNEIHPLKILVADDHEINRAVMCHLLGKMGYQVDEVIDGSEAVVSVINKKYDLVFMDLRMPNMGGIEATRWIREHHADQNVCIVALTGEVTEESKKRCRLAGMNGFLAKPVSLEDLAGIVRHASKSITGQIILQDESVEHWV